MQAGLAALLAVTTLLAPGCSLDQLCSDLFDTRLEAKEDLDDPAPPLARHVPSLPLAELLAGGSHTTVDAVGPDHSRNAQAAPTPPTPAPPQPESAKEPPPGAPSVLDQGVHTAHTGKAPTATGLPQPHAPQGRAPIAEGRAIEGAGAGAAAGLGAALAAIALYHRLTKETLLRHPTRRRVLALLEERPGIGTGDVASVLDCSYRTARHHLEKLAHFDLVRCHRGTNTLHWTLPEQQVVAPSLDECHRVLLKHVREHPGLHLSALAEAMGVAKSTAKHRLDRLVERGLVQEERVGPLRCFHAADEPSGPEAGSGVAAGPGSADRA